MFFVFILLYWVKSFWRFLKFFFFLFGKGRDVCDFVRPIFWIIFYLVQQLKSWSDCVGVVIFKPKGNFINYFRAKNVFKKRCLLWEINNDLRSINAFFNASSCNHFFYNTANVFFSLLLNLGVIPFFIRRICWELKRRDGEKFKYKVWDRFAVKMI